MLTEITSPGSVDVCIAVGVGLNGQGEAITTVWPRTERSKQARAAERSGAPDDEPPIVFTVESTDAARLARWRKRSYADRSG